jgi:hypothetical protein
MQEVSGPRNAAWSTPCIDIYPIEHAWLVLRDAPVLETRPEWSMAVRPTFLALLYRPEGTVVNALAGYVWSTS